MVVSVQLIGCEYSIKKKKEIGNILIKLKKCRYYDSCEYNINDQVMASTDAQG
jgi:hypothetical protein